MSTTHKEDYCQQEPRIAQIESAVNQDKDNISTLKGDYYHLREDIQELTKSVTELTTTLKLREADTQKLDKLENEVIQVKSTQSTLMWAVPIGCTIITLIINMIHYSG